MIQDISKTQGESHGSLRMVALVDGLLAFLAVGLVAFGLDVVFHAMH